MVNSLIDVLCVDDNEAIGEAVRCKIEAQPDMRWLGHLVAADSMAEQASALRPHVILLDLDMPGKHPLTAIAELAERCPGTRVIMLSGYVSEEHIDRAMEAGAWGYLAKSEGPDAIIAAVRRVVAGQVAFGPDVARQYFRSSSRFSAAS